MIITFANEQKQVKIPSKAKKLLLTGLKTVGKLHKLSEQTVVDVTLVDDKEIHKLNKEYRKVDRPTDVLSFALDEGEEAEPAVTGGPEEHLLGGIVISAETAERQGEEYGHGLNRELTYLAVHGCLHLLGYDHMQEEDKLKMRAEEEKVLAALNLSESDLASTELLKAAQEARKKAYAPYSGFKVGAAVLTKNGKIFSGCNIENASYGMTICAERCAIFNAVAAGEQDLEALCLTAETEDPVTPCGACRQVMSEFGLQTVIMADKKGHLVTKSLSELLPDGFKRKDLTKAKK